ncbi:MAG: nucleoside recognition domain-containing protein [Chthoniobacterales bacterium]
MLNYLWLFLVLAAVILGGFTGRLPEVATGAIEAAKVAVMNLALPLAGVMALWLGIMQLAEKSGLISHLATALRPILRRIFPEVPPDHPAMGSIVMNMAANMLGLSNAATPLGLRAMQDLEKINPHPGTASNAMCTFLALNTSSVQLIPATAVGILAAGGSKDPTIVIGTAFAATLCSTIAGLISVKTLQRLPNYRLPAPTPDRLAEIEKEHLKEISEEDSTHPSLSLFGKIALLALGLFLIYFGYLIFANDPAAREQPVITILKAISILAIPAIFAYFPLFAALRGVPVYEEFVNGAKEGFQVALRIIPFLVAILAAIAMFREAGGIDLIAKALAPLLSLLGIPADLLPLIFIRPLSGSGALGVFSELVQTHGADSLIARTGATIMGSTETTFYVIAVYFGSVAIKRTRHAVPAGLLADATGVIAAIIICHLMFE